jgi:DNA-directed RNA polymerase specialized sigma54-like protein
MQELRLKSTFCYEFKPLPKLIGRIKLSDFMDLKEEEFKNLIKNIENTYLFKKLMYPLNSQQKIIRFQTYSFQKKVEFKDELFSSSYFYFESIIEENKDLLKTIKKIGKEKFKEYFLFAQHNFPLKELAKKCNIKEGEIIKIIDLVNKIFLEERRSPLVLKEDVKSPYTKIAKINKVDGRLFIEYLNLYYLRGRYIIDYDKLSKLKESDYFSSQEKKELNHLIRILEMINFRKSTLHRILQEIVSKQERFLKSGDSKDKVIFPQKEVAIKLGLNPSLVSRAIRLKSVEVPWGEEIPLKDLFAEKKEVIKEFLKEIINGSKKITDKELTQIVKNKFGISLSRRSLNEYRREILKEFKDGKF